MSLVKLGYLFIRTIAKPIASGIKSYAKEHPKARSFFIQIAQSYHRLEVRLVRITKSREGVGRTTALNINPLNEQKAIELGANFIGESVVFLIAGVVLLADHRQNWAKEKLRRDVIEQRFQELYKETQLLREQMQPYIKETKSELLSQVKNK